MCSTIPALEFLGINLTAAEKVIIFHSYVEDGYCHFHLVFHGVLGPSGVPGGHTMRSPTVADLWCVKTSLSDFVAKTPNIPAKTHSRLINIVGYIKHVATTLIVYDPMGTPQRKLHREKKCSWVLVGHQQMHVGVGVKDRGFVKFKI